MLCHVACFYANITCSWFLYYALSLFSLFFQTSGGAVGVFAFIVWQPKPSSLLYPIWWKIAPQLLPSPDAIKAFSSICNQIDSQHRKFTETMYDYTCTNLHRRNRNGFDISFDCADGFLSQSTTKSLAKAKDHKRRSKPMNWPCICFSILYDLTIS